jgi:hypothetical protein
MKLHERKLTQSVREMLNRTPDAKTRITILLRRYLAGEMLSGARASGKQKIGFFRFVGLRLRRTDRTEKLSPTPRKTTTEICAPSKQSKRMRHNKWKKIAQECILNGEARRQENLIFCAFFRRPTNRFDQVVLEIQLRQLGQGGEHGAELFELILA